MNRIEIFIVTVETRSLTGQPGFNTRQGLWWNFSLRHCIQTGPGAHPASYPVGIRGFSMVIKRPGREADHSPPSSAEVKEW